MRWESNFLHIYTLILWRLYVLISCQWVALLTSLELLTCSRLITYLNSLYWRYIFRKNVLRTLPLALRYCLRCETYNIAYQCKHWWPANHMTNHAAFDLPVWEPGQQLDLQPLTEDAAASHWSRGIAERQGENSMKLKNWLFSVRKISIDDACIMFDFWVEPNHPSHLSKFLVVLDHVKLKQARGDTWECDHFPPLSPTPTHLAPPSNGQVPSCTGDHKSIIVSWQKSSVTISSKNWPRSFFPLMFRQGEVVSSIPVRDQSILWGSKIPRLNTFLSMKWFKTHLSLITGECAKKPLEILLELQGLAGNLYHTYQRWCGLPSPQMLCTGTRLGAEYFNQWTGSQIGLPKERRGVPGTLDCSGVFDRR